MPSEVFRDFVLKIINVLPAMLSSQMSLQIESCLDICCYHSWFAQVTLLGKFVSIRISNLNGAI